MQNRGRFTLRRQTYGVKPTASNLRRQTYGVKPTVSNLQCSQLEAEAQFDLEAAGRGLVPPQPDHNPPDDRLYF